MNLRKKKNSISTSFGIERLSPTKHLLHRHQNISKNDGVIFLVSVALVIYIFITYFVAWFLSANYAVSFIYEWNALLIYIHVYINTFKFTLIYIHIVGKYAILYFV